ncbi:MAG: folylpolyglutamate synthase/dihydrofolate synthase family protein [Hyphomonadaceae bacterium]
MRGIAARAGIDLDAFASKSAVITGSNGKGSTAAMLASILTESGLRTGLFTSPHLFAINERFQIDRAAIGDDALDKHWGLLEEEADGWALAHPAHAIGGFEFLFLVAASWFQSAQCDRVVWEAGIGGRHDVTRFTRARLSAITSLDLEHTKLLGETLEDIALDKADAVAAGGVLVLGESVAAFGDGVRAHAAARRVSVELAKPLGPGSPLRGVHGVVGLEGAHQRENAAVAAHLARKMGAADEAIARGLMNVNWPGRLETIETDPPIVIDVGHTPRAIEAALAGFLAMHPGDRQVLVVGASQDKRANEIVARLAPHFDVIVCAAALHKGAPADEIATAAFNANPRALIFEARSMREAHALAIGHARARGGAIYVAGGLFLAVEFQAVHEGRDPAQLAFF